jgi:hypothetical protein
MTSTCGIYTGSAVVFTVSDPGTIVVTTSLVVALTHTNGQVTKYWVSVWNQTTTTCNPESNNYVYGLVASQNPTGSYLSNVNLVQTFSVGGPGTYTISVIGTATMTSTSDLTEMECVSVAGVFYPS